MRRPLLGLLGILFVGAAAHAGGGPVADDPVLSIAPVVSGISEPTALAFLGAEDFLILEKSTGKVRRVTGGVLNPTTVLDLDVEACDERGLLGIALHPDFASNHFVYLYYNPALVAGGDTATCDYFTTYFNKVDRFVWDAAGNGGAGSLTLDTADIVSVHSDVPYHNGGSISFGPDEKLYGVIGDGGHNDFATNGKLQNSTRGDPDDTGIVFRVDDDGSSPSDNPFHAIAGMEKVFAYGIRNSFGITWDPVNGSLWESENGEDDYDEVNRIPAGMNGGWADIMGPTSRFPTGDDDLFVAMGSAYSDPEFSWKAVVAPTGIAFGGSALGAYENDLFVGDFENGFLYHFGLNAGRTGFALSGNLADGVADSASERDSRVAAEGFGFGVDTGGGISDLETGPNGKLYVVSIGQGAVYAVTAAAAGMTHDVSFTSLKPPKSVTFSPDPKLKSLKLSLENQGTAIETIENQSELDELVDVEIESLGGCPPPSHTLQPPKGGFPFRWAPRQKLSIGLDIAWACLNDDRATTKTENHDDFTLAAHLDLSALGSTDGDAGDDDCPRAPAGDDKGCGKAAAPFRIDLILK